jgi:spermidine synthase
MPNPQSSRRSQAGARTLRAGQQTSQDAHRFRTDRDVRISEDRGRPALLVNGVVQSVAPAAAIGGYWPAMLPEQRPRRALLLGVGGATIAHLLAARFGPLHVLGVDDDPSVLRAARVAFGVPPEGLQFVLADAFAFAAACAARFDYIAVDLFHGDRAPVETFGRPFLRALKTGRRVPARIAFNVFRDRYTAGRIERIGAVLHVERQITVGLNVIVHCRT